MSMTLKKSILIIIITLVFLFFAQTQVKAVTIDSEEALKEAFEGKNATVEGKTVTLTGNVEFVNPEWNENSEDEYYDVIEFSGEDYILKLNGNTLSAYELYLNSGSVTIHDFWGGTIRTKEDGMGIWIYPEAKLIVNNATFDSAITNQGTLNIKNGMFRKFIQNYFDYDYEKNVLNSIGVLNIENGEFSGIGQEGIATISGGTFRDTAGFTPLTIYIYEENESAASTTIKGGEFITSNPETYDAIAIFNSLVTLKEDEINKYIADEYVATYDKATIVSETASPFVSYTSTVKVSSQKILDLLDRIAPNGVWTVNSYEPKESPEDMTVLTAALKEALQKEKADLSLIEEVYAWCDTSSKEAIIQLRGYGSGTMETRKVKVVYNEPDEDTNKIINEFLAKIDKLNLDEVNEKTAYKVEDLYLINYLYNAKNGIDNSLALNFSKELIKAANGINIYFRFYGGFGGADSTELYTFEGGQGAVLHEGMIYASINSGVTMNHVLYIPADTEDSTDAYINAAMRRIKDYLGTTEGIEIEVGGTFESLIDYDGGMTHWNENGFIDETTCGSYYFNIKINEGTYRFAICKKDAEELETPEYLASDIMSNISIKSNSTEVPLDTAISAEKITSDEIEKALGTKVYVAFDISLYSKAKDKSITSIKNDKFIVSVPVPEILKDKKIIVYYINSNGERKEHIATVKDGFAIFETDHFSTYALVEKTDENNEEKAYKVIFNANGGKYTNGTETLVYEKWKVSDYENLEEPTRDGYTFKGYYTENNGGTKFEMILNESGINNDMTFYAQWEENSSEVTPDNNDNTTGNINASNDNSTGNNPQTGDNILFFVGLLFIATIGIIITTRFRKYYKNK